MNSTLLLLLLLLWIEQTSPDLQQIDNGKAISLLVVQQSKFVATKAAEELYDDLRGTEISQRLAYRRHTRVSHHVALNLGMRVRAEVLESSLR